MPPSVGSRPAAPSTPRSDGRGANFRRSAPSTYAWTRASSPGRLRRAASRWRRSARFELRRRREMVARACHELRGPLTAVRLSLATMERRQEAPPERLATLDHELRRAGLALDDFAAARSGRRIVDREEPVEVAELLEEQFHSWEAVAGAFDSVVRARLRCCRARSSSATGCASRRRSRTSSPTRSSTRPGRIELTARLVGAQHVRIEVIDEGPGLPIPLAELTRRARAAGRGRRGRGLAIAAQIAERHRGRLVAAPAPQRHADRHRAAARAARAAMSRRRRALLLGGLALVLGGLAAFNVAGREAALERRVGGLVDVVVAREPIAAGERLATRVAGDPPRARALRARTARPASPQAFVGRRAAVDIPADADLNAGDDRPRRRRPGRSRRAPRRARRGDRRARIAGARHPGQPRRRARHARAARAAGRARPSSRSRTSR